MEILEYCQKIGEESHKQEVERKRIIDMKCDYLFKWLTLFTAIFNVAIPVIVQSIGDNCLRGIYLLLYVSLMVFLVLAMLMVIFCNLPQKVKLYPLGHEALKEIQKNPKKYNSKEDLKYQNILYKDALTKQMKNNNNRNVIFISISYICLILAIGTIAVLFGTIMWGI